VLLAVAVFALGIAVLRGAEGPQTLDDRAHAVASTLRCPVCLNLSVADSPSSVAQEMRRQIRRELQAGMTADRVRARFVAAYGQWILLSPPKRGLTLTAWLIPPLLLLASAIAAGLTVRRWTGPTRPRSGPPKPALSEADRQLLAGELARLPEGDLYR